MKTDPNSPANPFFKWNEPGYGDCITIYSENGSKQFIPYQQGLTKRELFAAMALSGLCSQRSHIDMPTIVNEAVVIADKLINELNKENG